MTSFQVSISPEDAVLRVAGDLDLATHADLERALWSAAVGREQLMLDLADLAFIDSMGIRAVLDARRTAERLGCKLTVRAPSSPDSRRPFELTGLDEVLGWHSEVRPRRFVRPAT